MSEKQRPDIGQIDTFHLDNGISLYVRKNSAAPMATVQAWVRTGSIHEGEDLGCGLSHFLEHMLFQGSSEYSSEEIMDTVHENGGEMNAFTSFAATCYYMDILANAADKAIDVLTNMLQAPLFKEKIFKTEKDVILRECAMSNDNPNRQINQALWKTVFLHHPVRHPIIGYKEGIESVNRKMMIKYHRQRYTPERIFFVVSGDVDPEEIARHLEKRISKIHKGNIYDPPIIAEPEQQCTRHEKLYYDDPLARIIVGFRVPDVSSPDTPALDLLASVLGHSKSSRLVKNIRNTKHLALNVDAFCYSSVFDGIFSVSATTDPEKLPELKDAILAEICNISKGVEKKELEKVKKQLITNFYRGLRSNSGIAHIIGNSVLTYNSPEYACKYMEDIEKVTEQDLVDMAERYLDINKASIIEMLPTEFERNHKKSEDESSENYFPEKISLSGKTKLIYIKNNTSPLVDISLILPGGTICEGRELAGISMLTAKLLVAGTQDYSEEEFAELLDSNAISLSVSGGNNTFTLKLNCHIDSLTAALKALNSMLSAPLFDEAVLEREKAMAINSLKTRNISPMYAADKKLSATLYGVHPYAYPNEGTEESLKSMSVEKIKEFYFNTILNRSKAVIGIAGNIERSNAEKSAEKILSSAPWSKSPIYNEPEPPLFPDKSCRKHVKIPKEQTVVMIGVPGCSNRDEDRFELDIIQTSLNGLSSRLFKSIRDDAGLAYYTGLYAARGLHAGSIAFYAGTAPESAEYVLDLIEKEKNKLASRGLTKREVKGAVARLKGESATQKLNPGSILFQCTLSEFYGNGFMEPWSICEKYATLSQKTVNKVVKKYFSNKNSVTIIAGP